MSDSSPPLSNPYHASYDWPDLVKVTGRVSPQDHVFLNTLFPFVPSLQDKIISTLYARFIAELRTHLDTRNGADIAYYIDHPSVDLLRRVISRCSFGESVGSGGVGPRDDTGGVGSVCATMQCASPVGGDQEQSPSSGERDLRREKEIEDEKILSRRQRLGSNAPAGTD